MKVNVDLIWAMLCRSETKLLASGTLPIEEIKESLQTVLEIVPDVIDKMKSRKVIYQDDSMITWSDECTIYKDSIDDVYLEGNFLFFKTDGKCYTAYYIVKEKEIL